MIAMMQQIKPPNNLLEAIWTSPTGPQFMLKFDVRMTSRLQETQLRGQACSQEA